MTDAAHLAQAMEHIRVMQTFLSEDALQMLDCMRNRFTKECDTEAYLTQAADNIQRSAEIELQSQNPRSFGRTEPAALDAYFDPFPSWMTREAI